MDLGVYYLMILAITVILHELGHYAAYRLFGVHPNIKIKWWGIMMGSEETSMKLTTYQMSVIAYFGVGFGLIYLAFVYVEAWFYLLYIIMCFVDFVILYEGFTIKKDRLHIPRIEGIKIEMEELIKEHEKPN